MSFRFYHVLALIPRTSPIVLDELSEQLRQSCGVPVVVEAAGASVSFGAYRFALTLEEGPAVQQENAEVLRMLDIPGGGAEFPQRLVTAGDPDPDMEHFNDFMFLLESLEKAVPDVVLFDSNAQERV